MRAFGKRFWTLLSDIIWELPGLDVLNLVVSDGEMAD